MLCFILGASITRVMRRYCVVFCSWWFAKVNKRYCVACLCVQVKTVSHDTSQLSRLLYTVKALVSNKTLFLEPKPYVHITIVLYFFHVAVSYQCLGSTVPDISKNFSR